MRNASRRTGEMKARYRRPHLAEESSRPAPKLYFPWSAHVPRRRGDDRKPRSPQAGGTRTAISDFEQISPARSEEHTSELQSLMRISYAVFCLTKTKNPEV